MRREKGKAPEKEAPAETHTPLHAASGALTRPSSSPLQMTRFSTVKSKANGKEKRREVVAVVPFDREDERDPK